ncbi:MAG TPA: nitroreductase family protein [Pyrinomonadaceae bacterium]
MSTADTATRVADDTECLARLLEGRWSCRGFLPDPVSRETITRILDLARRSPSDCNTQPWHVFITVGEGTERFRAALSAHAPAVESNPDFSHPTRYPNPYLRRRMECAFQLYSSVGIAMADRAASAKQVAKNFEFFGAPHAAIITTEAELGVYGAIDCGLYLQTFLLAAHSLGLGAVPQAALANYAPFIRKYFDLPGNRLIVCGVSFGWPDHDHPANSFRTSRVSVEETVTWVE